MSRREHRSVDNALKSDCGRGPSWWLFGVVIRTLDLRLSVKGSVPGHDTAWLFLDRWPSLAGKQSWDITTTQVNSALHPTEVAKSSTSFWWGESEKVTADGWQVTLWSHIACDFHKLLYSLYRLRMFKLPWIAVRHFNDPSPIHQL